MRRYKAYLAGAFCSYGKFNDWRDFVAKNLSNERIKLVDPRFNSNQLCPATFTMDDANNVLESDILFHYRTRGYEDDGASWEHGIAFGYNLLWEKDLVKKKKLILYADDTNVPFPLHSGSADITFNSLEKAVEFLNLLDSLKKDRFMGHWMGLLDKEREGD